MAGNFIVPVKPYLTGMDNEGWQNIASTSGYLITSKGSFTYENKTNLMIAKINY